jgi:hypothetical protein
MRPIHVSLLMAWLLSASACSPDAANPAEPDSGTVVPDAAPLDPAELAGTLDRANTWLAQAAKPRRGSLP